MTFTNLAAGATLRPLSVLFCVAVWAATPAYAVNAGLQASLQQLASESDGRLGICAVGAREAEPTCVNGAQKFPLQSVMKLVVAAAVMDATDHKLMQLSDAVVVRPDQASPGPQEFADQVRRLGALKTTVQELLQRAVVDSDSTSVDILIDRLGGVAVVQDFLKRRQVAGISIDRDERHLQAESVGLTWQSGYAAPGTFEAAVQVLPIETRDKAWSRYLKDPRDTATPAGMVGFLRALTAGQLLSAPATRQLLAVMASTATGSDRLKAGLLAGWSLGHKTGTGRAWRGMTAVTNDVGVLTAPDGGTVAVAVFLAESSRPNGERAAVLAQAAKLVTGAYQAKK